MKPTLAYALLILLISCSKSDSDDPISPTSADRTKFVGMWAGDYSCPGGGSFPDTMIIQTASGVLDFNIIIHKGFLNPDTITGELTTPNLLKVPEQTMGGAPGTAQITFQNDLLIYSQSGFGITCGGTNYALVP
jgi:hypothetical protein